MAKCFGAETDHLYLTSFQLARDCYFQKCQSIDVPTNLTDPHCGCSCQSIIMLAFMLTYCLLQNYYCTTIEVED